MKPTASAQTAWRSALASPTSETLELGDVEHLAHGARHVDEVGAQRVANGPGLQRIDPCTHDGEWRAQFVGHVGSEVALRAEARLETVETPG